MTSKDKCYIQSKRRVPTENCIVTLHKETHARIKELSCETGKSITVLADELLQFALDRKLSTKITKFPSCERNAAKEIGKREEGAL